MKIFKFGGASVDSVDRIRRLPSILALYGSENLMIVISAMGKTTNALEKVANAFMNAILKKHFFFLKKSNSSILRSLTHWGFCRRRVPC